MSDLDIELVRQQAPQLGRQKVHDPRSRAFALPMAVERADWRTKSIRIYDPAVNPNQCHSECTGCAKAMQFNAVGNRVSGRILDMDYAHKNYALATAIDPFPGTWPGQDTGSSGLASAQAAQKLGIGGAYYWIFNGADGVVDAIQQGKVVSVGTWWLDGMTRPDAHHVIEPTGKPVGGHQYAARAYDLDRDMVGLRCWWGSYKDVWIKRAHLNDLILDGGDAHTQVKA